MSADVSEVRMMIASQRLDGRMTVLRRASFALGLSFLSSAAALAAEVEAKKDDVEIYADATNKSGVVGKLAKGESLAASERKGMFWQVKLKDGGDGFVSIMAVKHKPDGGGDLAKAIKSVTAQGRQTDEAAETRARSAVMGVRGLREDDSAGNAGTARPNLRAVYAMEDRQVPSKQLEELGDSVLKEIARKQGED